MKETALDTRKNEHASTKRNSGSISLVMRDNVAEIDILNGLIQRMSYRGSPHPLSELSAEIANMSQVDRSPVVLSLQRARGNGFVQRMAAQAKLIVGPEDDEYKREADRVAEQVMSAPSDATLQMQTEEKDEEMIKVKPLNEIITPQVQRQIEKEEKFQTKSTFHSMGLEGAETWPKLENIITQVRGNGRLLAEGVRSRINKVFGEDFSSVIIHSDSQANQMNRYMQARAFTKGNDILFHPRILRSQKQDWSKAPSHELGHIIKQKGCPNYSQEKVLQMTKGKGSHRGKRHDVPEPIKNALRDLCYRPLTYGIFNNSENILPAAPKGCEYHEADAGSDRQGGRGQYRVVVLANAQGNVIKKYYSFTHYGTGKGGWT